MKGLPDLPFPSPRDKLKGEWLSIRLEPVVGSGERITVGVAVATENGFEVVPVPGLNRLHCFYDDQAAGLIELVQIALEALRVDLSARGREALHSVSPIFSGIEFGPVQQGVGDSISDITEMALRETSSLVRPEDTSLVLGMETTDIVPSMAEPAQGAREPLINKLVRDFVVERRPSLAGAFSRPFALIDRKTKSKRARGVIGFVGSRMVSNFGAISPTRPGASFRPIQGGLWTLNVFRDTRGLFNAQQYQMIVQRPEDSSLPLTRKQKSAISEVYEELAAQAKAKDIDMVARPAIEGMGLYLLEQERPASESLQ